MLVSACALIKEPSEEPVLLKALIVDGQNNHKVWPMSTMMMKAYLEETGKFSVDIERTKFTWKGTELRKSFPLDDGKVYEDLDQPQKAPNFQPDFSQYDVVVTNFGWKAAEWPKETKKAFEAYMKNGGGLVVVHAADNSFPEWQAYNEMIALGGWGNRNEKDGPYLYYDENGKLIRDNSKGGAGAHGKRHEFQIQAREAQHPIMQGIPEKWMQAPDELYAKLRGPAKNLTILASAYEKFKTQRHEPVLMVIDYFEGRVFHTTLGHDKRGFESVGFITTFQRGSEWAATGNVTIPIPSDFPTENKSSSRAFQSE